MSKKPKKANLNIATKPEKPKRPTRDEFELEELATRLGDAKQEDEEVVLTVWGMDDIVQGRIDDMDPRTGMVHVLKYGEVTKVKFMDIMNVESPSI